jgi:hypothetical protein
MSQSIAVAKARVAALVDAAKAGRQRIRTNSIVASVDRWAALL